MKKLLIWQALTPVHSGTGQSGAGAIDLPIAREVATNFPILPASSIKGVFRDGRGLDSEEIVGADHTFGYTNKKKKGSEDASSAAGAYTFTDARLLCLPVRSYRSTFAYVTCPLVIQRLKREAAALGMQLELPDLPQDLQKAHLVGTGLMSDNKVLFEDIDMEAETCSHAESLGKLLEKWTGQSDIAERLAVLPNDVFTYFAETATEVSAHIALDPNTKVVKNGALWYEETLPAEALLTSWMLKVRDNVNSDYTPPKCVQLGGKATTGKGLLSIHTVPPRQEATQQSGGEQ